MARNSFCFENTRLDSAVILDKATVDAEIWRTLHSGPQEQTSSSRNSNLNTPVWLKPPQGWIKCNIGASWVSRSSNSGGSWIVRDALGSMSFHSRRFFASAESPLVADLNSLLWSVEAMASLKLDKIMFATSSGVLRDALQRKSYFCHVNGMVSEVFQRLNSFSEWRLDHVEKEENKVASLIASSVTSGNRFQSYVATSGPFWLKDLLAQEAA